MAPLIACGARTALDEDRDAGAHVAPPDAGADVGVDAGPGSSRCALVTGGDPIVVFRATPPARLDAPQIAWSWADIDFIAVERTADSVAARWHRIDERFEAGAGLDFPGTPSGPIRVDTFHVWFPEGTITRALRFPRGEPVSGWAVPGPMWAALSSEALVSIESEDIERLAWVDLNADGTIGGPRFASERVGPFVVGYAGISPTPRKQAWGVGAPGGSTIELSVRYTLGDIDELHVGTIERVHLGQGRLAMGRHVHDVAIVTRDDTDDLVLIVADSRAREITRIPLGVHDARGDYEYSVSNMGFIFIAALVFDEPDPTRGQLHVIVVDPRGSPIARLAVPAQRAPGETMGGVDIQADNSPITAVHWSDWEPTTGQSVTRAMRISCSDFMPPRR